MMRVAGVTMCAVAGATVAPVGAQAEELTYRFSATGAEQSFVVPAGVTNVHMLVRGGRGAGGAQAAEVSDELGIASPSRWLQRRR
jgi:hypothetical protein